MPPSGEPPIEHGMDVPPGTAIPEGFELGDGIRRESACVQEWAGCDSGEYNPSCCRFPKSCSATSVRNRAYRAGSLEPATAPTEATRQPLTLKQALGTLDIEFDLEDGDILTDVVVIAKVSRLDGETTVLHATTAGTDGITKLGLVTAAQRVISARWEPYNRSEEE